MVEWPRSSSCSRLEKQCLGLLPKCHTCSMHSFAPGLRGIGRETRYKRQASGESCRKVQAELLRLKTMIPEFLREAASHFEPAADVPAVNVKLPRIAIILTYANEATGGYDDLWDATQKELDGKCTFSKKVRPMRSRTRGARDMISSFAPAQMAFRSDTGQRDLAMKKESLMHFPMRSVTFGDGQDKSGSHARKDSQQCSPSSARTEALTIPAQCARCSCRPCSSGRILQCSLGRGWISVSRGGSLNSTLIMAPHIQDPASTLSRCCSRHGPQRSHV